MQKHRSDSAWSALERHQGSLFVIKLGGAPLADPEVLDTLARDLSVLARRGIRFVIVHGGGPQLSELSCRLGLEPTKVNGRRVTDPETLRLAKMVFAGEISTDIVAALRRHGLSGVGLSGVDGNLISAERRGEVRLLDHETGEVRSVDFGDVGDVRSVDTRVLDTLLAAGFVPVIASLASDAEGKILNVNADTIAAEVAVGQQADKLVLMSDVPGILADGTNPSTRISTMTLDEVRDFLATGAATHGMVPKLDGVVRALENGTGEIHLIDAQVRHALLDEVSAPGSCGTFITLPKHEVVTVG